MTLNPDLPPDRVLDDLVESTIESPATAKARQDQVLFHQHFRIDVEVRFEGRQDLGKDGSPCFFRE